MLFSLRSFIWVVFPERYILYSFWISSCACCVAAWLHLAGRSPWLSVPSLPSRCFWSNYSAIPHFWCIPLLIQRTQLVLIKVMVWICFLNEVLFTKLHNCLRFVTKLQTDSHFSFIWAFLCDVCALHHMAVDVGVLFVDYRQTITNFEQTVGADVWVYPAYNENELLQSS